MATIEPGTRVQLAPGEREKLRFPPPDGMLLFVAVHRGALRKSNNRHTQVVAIDDNSQLAWTGGVGEDMLEIAVPAAAFRSARSVLANCLLKGDALWMLVRPGVLTRGNATGPLSTVYDGDRPWLVVGELGCETVLAAPLNDATNPKPWTPIVRAKDLPLASKKDSQVELAHVWSLPRPGGGTCRLAADARLEVEERIRKHYALASA